MYVDTAIEARVPVRKAILKKDVAREMLKWVRISNCYVSVYCFERIDEKKRPDKSSAIINKIYLDIDIMDSDGIVKDVNVKDIIEWCRKNDFKRWHAFTGGGFMTFIEIENATPERLYSAHYYLRNNLGFKIDPACIDVMRCRRFVPSYNFNKGAYSSYINEEEMLEDFKVVRSRYMNPKNIKTRPVKIGTRKWNIKGLKPVQGSAMLPSMVLKKSMELEAVEKINGEVCDTILRIGRKEHVSHLERFFIILYIKDVLKVPYSEFPSVYSAIIGNKRDLVHSIHEQQARYVYSGNGRFSPHLFKMYGYCDLDCTRCLETMEFIENIEKTIIL